MLLAWCGGWVGAVGYRVRARGFWKVRKHLKAEKRFLVRERRPVLVWRHPLIGWRRCPHAVTGTPDSESIKALGKRVAKARS
jgi:hypothetical protein